MEALSMTEAKQKLAELEKHMPNQEGTVYDFGHFLAERLNPSLVPQGFVMACELAIYDLGTGVDGFTNKPIHNELVGYPPVVYMVLRMTIPGIAKAIFPAEFAQEVETVIREVNKRM